MGRGGKSGRGILAVCLAILWTAFFSGCGNAQPEVVELTFIHGWGTTEADHEAMRRIYSDFEKENPDVRLKMISMPTNGEVIRRTEDMLMVGEIPDIIFLGGTGRDSVYRFMVENDAALDLMPYVRADREFGENLSASNLDYWTTRDGRLYTVSDVLLLSGGYWYNKDIWEAAGVSRVPATWEEFFEVCGKVRSWAQEEDNGVQPLWVLPEGYLYFADHMMADNGGRMEESIRRDRVEPDEGEMRRLLDAMEKVYAYSGVSAEEYSYRDETQLFNEGKLAMYINGVWGASMIREEVDASYALLPSSGRESISCESAGLGYVLGNSGDTRRQEAAVRFLKYMMSRPVQERILLETGQMPANPNVDVEALCGGETRFWQAVDRVQSAQRRIEAPDNLWENDRKNVFLDNILDVLSGKLNRQTFLDLL